jgi:dihydrofolate synthase/folylpolyglutamate synthase
MVVCDTGHNEDGIRLILDQIGKMNFGHLWMVIGMVRDKDISKILSMLPKDASYIFCEAKIPRALPASDLAEAAFAHGLTGKIVPDVNEAIAHAKQMAKENDLIFIGGSTFVVAEIENL